MACISTINWLSFILSSEIHILVLFCGYIVKEKIEFKFYIVADSLESFQGGEVEDTVILCACLAFLIVLKLFLIDMLQRNIPLERETSHVSSCFLNLFSKSVLLFSYLN